MSRQHLGYDETIRQLEMRLRRCHPNSEPFVQAQLLEAQRGRGPTAFDRVVEVIREHAHIQVELL